MGFIVAIVFLVLYILEKKKRSRDAQERDENAAALLDKSRELEEMTHRLSDSNGKLENVTKMFSAADKRVDAAEKKLAELHYDDYAQVQEAIEQGNRTISDNNSTIATLQSRIAELSAQEEKLSKQVRTATNKLSRSRELYKSVDYSITAFFEADPALEHCKLPSADAADFNEYAPSVTLHLHSMDMKALAKAFRDNNKQIESLMEKYAGRYTTKANQAIYRLMVIALRAELQNILYNLKYEKLDVGEEQVKAVTTKYLAIATDGNQSIAGTMTKFIGQMEYLFLNAVKIEYNYYVKKEQARAEQAAIREQMRQEAAERKALEAEQKKIEAEESKYQTEIERVHNQLSAASGAEADTLRQRVLELESMLSDVRVKKDDITRLQNGKAGTVYIISNLGSFGENVFKIGMTRRLTPQERVDELGSASVPFNFDVHSFIFSQDAVELEGQLHKRLNNQRVNKVNARKEFFYSTVDELEALVNEIDPSAEFTRTMAAEDFRQSQSTDEAYVSIETAGDDEDE